MAKDAIRLDHLALAVRDVREVLPFLVGELGGREDVAGPGMGFRFWQWEFAGGGRIEILQPEGPTDGFLYRFLDARGPGPHHLTFKVPDLHDAAKRSGELGYDVLGLDTSQPAWMEAFLHPKQAQGIVVQLAGVGAIGLFVTAASALTWFSLRTSVGLRLTEVGEALGIDEVETGMRAYPEFETTPVGAR